METVDKLFVQTIYALMDFLGISLFQFHFICIFLILCVPILIRKLHNKNKEAKYHQENYNILTSDYHNTLNKLQCYENIFQHIADISIDVIFIMDKKYVLTYVNKRFSSYFNSKPEYYIGKNVFDWLHVKHKAILQEHIEKFQRDLSLTELSFETSSLNKKYFYRIFLFVSRDSNQNIVGYKGLIRDISKETLLKKNATVDSLTSVYNRAYFDVFFKKSFINAQENRKPIILMIIDLDFFKCVNDTYGHICGDEVLKSFASVVKNTIRRDDYFFRIGGEEFAIISTNAMSEEQIKKFGKSLCEKIENHSIPFNKDDIKITISIGASSQKMEDVHEKELFNRADDALYMAKKQGRNRAIIV